MKIAIVEDEKEHRQLIRKYIEDVCENKNIKYQIFEFESGEQFLFENEDMNADVVFLDIQMPGISGVELARKLRENDNNIFIVFATGIDDYIEEGYDLDAIHYLKKPINKDKLSLCMDKINKKNDNSRYILFDTDNGKYKVNIKDIVSIEAAAHNTRIVMRKKEDFFEIKSTVSLGDMEQRLSGFAEFQKTHRSYLVNLSYVKNITKTDVVMDNESVIPLSRRMYKEVNENFIRYFLGK